jgi:hypothetical protein
MRKFSVISVMFLMVAMSMFFGCTNNFREIPAGHVGKILTPTGWEKGIREAGMVDVGVKNSSGTYNVLVLLEASATSVKESFGQAGGGNGAEDHRILVGKTPVTVDVYVRMVVPTDPERRNSIFAQIQPDGANNAITLSRIYVQFAQMDIRSGIRAILQKEESVEAITKNLDKYNAMLGDMAIRTFEKNGVPLEVQNVTISNIKMDATVWEAENQKAAALAQVEAINKIGAAVRANPEYMQFRKYDTYEKIAPKIGSFTIIEGNPNGIVAK